MKRLPEAVPVLAIVLLTASLGWGQATSTLQTGDVFAGVGNGHINWYRFSGDGLQIDFLSFVLPLRGNILAGAV